MLFSNYMHLNKVKLNKNKILFYHGQVLDLDAIDICFIK